LYEGLFAADTDEPGWGWQIVSRLTWQLPQTAIGLSMSNYFNVANDGRAVEFRNGATVLDVRGQLDGNPDFVNGIAVGSYITGEDILSRPRLFRHEFGHYLQSRASGPFYLVKYGMPNLLVTSFTNREHWSEGDADARSAAYFGGTYRRRDFRNPTAWEYMFPSFAPIHFLISIW
jgi:hypothetical protein